MLVITTIYFAEVTEPIAQERHDKLQEIQPDTARSREVARELLSMHEGKNRVLRIDREK